MSEQDNKPANLMDELKLHTQNLAEEFREVFPKVDPALVYDLISRLTRFQTYCTYLCPGSVHN